MTSYGCKSSQPDIQIKCEQLQTSGKKRVVDKLKIAMSNGPTTDALTPNKQAMLISMMHQKDKVANKVSYNSAGCSGKASIQGKLPGNSQRNEYLSTQQTKSQIVGQQPIAGCQYSSTRSLSNKKELQRQLEHENNGPGSQSQRL